MYTTARHIGTSAIRELLPSAVISVHADEAAHPNPYASGYGPAIPTRFRVTLSDGRSRRVYVAQYGNSGSAYVNVTEDGVRVWAYLDTATEHALQQHTTAPVAGKGNQHECPQARPQRACRQQAV